MFKQLLACIVLLVNGCDGTSAMKNEALNKAEYSILQSFEYEYRGSNNDKPYLVVKNALKTKSTVVAFPIKGKSTGYVVMLAQAEGLPKTKVMPEVDFAVTKEAFEAVKARTFLSPEIEQVIVAHIH